MADGVSYGCDRKIIFYQYDSLQRLKSLINKQGQELDRYEYDAQNWIKETQYGTGITTTYECGDDGQISRLTTRSTDRSRDCTFLDYHYRYDGNGNRTEKQGYVWVWDGESSKEESVRFCYDPKDQLSEEWYGDQKTSYAYDPAGNQIQKEKEGELCRYFYSAKNQLVSMEKSGGTRHYQYDKQGSLTAEQNGEERIHYQYDSLNRQQEIIKADGTFQRNRYDAEGLRAEMEENGRLCRFIFHRGEIISEEVGSESGSYLSSRYIRGNGVEYLEQEGTTYSFQKDEQGSTVFLLDREKEIAGSYAYDGFGNLRKNAGFGKHGNRILYAGQQYDGWSEQYYLRARYYRPNIGRFTQEDVYRGDGLNLYAYCTNNPVTYYDPSGYNGIPQCNGVQFADGLEKIYDENGVRIPYGFKSLEDYNKFTAEMKAMLPEGTEIYFQGSSVTGVGHSSGLPFDYNRTSDFDIALVNDDLFIGALENNYRVKTDPNRIGPMNDRQLSNLGLNDAQNTLSNLANRDVSFMLFESSSDAMRRPSLPVY